MATYGSPDYKIGLVVARSQPFHNGHLRAICDALMQCDEVIFCVRDYDTAFFDYNSIQKFSRVLLDINFKIAFYGIKSDPLLITPKLIMRRIIDSLDEDNYRMPTHFFTNDESWMVPAMEVGLEAFKIPTLPDTRSDEIWQSIVDGTDFWKSRVPKAIREDVASYIATKNRNF